MEVRKDWKGLRKEWKEVSLARSIVALAVHIFLPGAGYLILGQLKKFIFFFSPLILMVTFALVMSLSAASGYGIHIYLTEHRDVAFLFGIVAVAGGVGMVISWFYGIVDIGRIVLFEDKQKEEMYLNLEEMKPKQEIFCTQCGVKLSPDAKFCENCGNKCD